MAAALTIGGCSSVKEDSVVLSVGDTNVTAGVAGFYARFNQAQYETYYGAYLGENMWTQEAEEGKTYAGNIPQDTPSCLGWGEKRMDCRTAGIESPAAGCAGRGPWL